MQATITVFLSETHIDRFYDEESDDSDLYIIDHPEGLNYIDAVRTVPRILAEIGGKLVGTYSERNEFNDPITSYFVEL